MPPRARGPKNKGKGRAIESESDVDDQRSNKRRRPSINTAVAAAASERTSTSPGCEYQMTVPQPDSHGRASQTQLVSPVEGVVMTATSYAGRTISPLETAPSAGPSRAAAGPSHTTSGSSRTGAVPETDSEQIDRLRRWDRSCRAAIYGPKVALQEREAAIQKLHDIFELFVRRYTIIRDDARRIDSARAKSEVGFDFTTFVANYKMSRRLFSEEEVKGFMLEGERSRCPELFCG